MDARTSDDRDDLANPVSNYHRHVWLRVRSGDTEQAVVEGGFTVRHQFGGEPDLHSDPVRDAKSAFGGSGYRDCLDHHHLVGHGRLEAL